METSIGVNLPGINVGVTLGNTSPSTPTPAPTIPAPVTQENKPMALTQKQMLVPVKDPNGSVVRWSLQTIEYDDQFTNATNVPKNFSQLAPWMTPYRVISTP